MKIAVPAIIALFVAFSFSSAAEAGYSRRAQMSGYDATYKSTGKCTAGACAAKKGAKKPAKPN